MEKEMPEGIEWPRYESGDLVMFGDCVENRNGTCTVNSVRFYSGGGVTVYGEDRGSRLVVVTEPVMHEPIRKARPKVLAADGEPLEAGQTVWHVATGREYTVRSCTNGGAHLSRDGKPAGYCRAEYLTHQRPVLDADGVPIELGDDLYSVEGGLKLHVSTIDRVNCRIATAEMFALDRWADPSMFTHTKPEPDTWERIEHDAKVIDETIESEWGGECTDARDLVRRCREVAERERGE